MFCTKTSTLVIQMCLNRISSLSKRVLMFLTNLSRCVSTNISFFESIPYYTIVHSNDDSYSHFPNIVNLLSSSLDDSIVTWDVSPTPLQVYQRWPWPIEILVRNPSSTNNDIMEPMPDLSPTLSFVPNPIFSKLIDHLVGTHSTHNPSPCYTNHDYRPFSTIHYTNLSLFVIFYSHS